MNDTRSSNEIGAVPDHSESAGSAERRVHHRYPFSALAEVIELHTRARLTCRASDLSFGGIYVDTVTPFAVGASVMVRLTCEGRSFQAGAKVTYTLDGMGMGLAFVPQLPPEQVTALHTWIAELSGDLLSTQPSEFDSPIADSHPSRYSPTTDDLESLREVTRDLVEVLLHKEVLTGSEASALWSKLAR